MSQGEFRRNYTADGKIKTLGMLFLGNSELGRLVAHAAYGNFQS